VSDVFRRKRSSSQLRVSLRSIGDPNIGTSTFIVTNDTAVNSSLTPSRVGSSKQERTCSPLLSSTSLPLSLYSLFFILPSFLSTNAPGCSALTVSYRGWNSVNPSVVSSYEKQEQLRQRDSGELPCGLRSWKIGWDFVVDIVVVAVPDIRRRISFTPLQRKQDDDQWRKVGKR